MFRLTHASQEPSINCIAIEVQTQWHIRRIVCANHAMPSTSTVVVRYKVQSSYAIVVWSSVVWRKKRHAQSVSLSSGKRSPVALTAALCACASGAFGSIVPRAMPSIVACCERKRLRFQHQDCLAVLRRSAGDDARLKCLRARDANANRLRPTQQTPGRQAHRQFASVSVRTRQRSVIDHDARTLADYPVWFESIEISLEAGRKKTRRERRSVHERDVHGRSVHITPLSSPIPAVLSAATMKTPSAALTTSPVGR